MQSAVLLKANLLVFSCAIFICSSNLYAAPRYPNGFLWGVSMSAHQTEGAFEGGENSDWWNFEREQENDSPRANGTNADIAANHWNLYEHDITLAKEIGINSIRTSVAWEKIQPTPTSFNPRAIEHYRNVLIKMKEHGIRPIITLHHFTNPNWFHLMGGWLSPDSPRIFLKYAKYVVSNLGDLCDVWITFHEPLNFVLQAYVSGDVPPHLKSVDAGYEAAFQLARAHRIVAQMIHDLQGYSPGAHGPGGRLKGVGLAIGAQYYEPYNQKSKKDQLATETITDLMNWAFVRGITKGKLEFRIPDEVDGVKSFERKLPSQDLPPWDVGPSLDWLGLNYRSRYKVKYDATGPFKAKVFNTGNPVIEDKLEIYPQGLEKIIRQAARRFVYPIVITGNGIADSKDFVRPFFLKKHLESLDAAVFGSTKSYPIDVRGYLHWTLLDGFEWLAGYKHKYGLIEVDYNLPSLPRRMRTSAQIYTAKINDASR